MSTLTALFLFPSSAAASHDDGGDRQAPPPHRAAPADEDADAISVTATPIALPIDKIAASRTAIDKGAIDRMQPIGVSEFLLRPPGVSLARTGGDRTATSQRICGAESGRSGAIIDGVTLNDPTPAGGGHNVTHLLTAYRHGTWGRSVHAGLPGRF